MNLSIALLAAAAGYLLGAISFSRVASKLILKKDVIEDIELPVEGSNETFRITATGASAASMRMGGGVGCAIGWLDILKVTLPTLAFRLLYPDQSYYLIAATAGMVGHNWPVYYRFKGGRGVSAAYGGLIVVDWVGTIVCAVGGLVIGLVVLRDFVIAYLMGLWLVIPWLWVRTGDPATIVYAITINILFMLAMIPDLRQYNRLRKQGLVSRTAAMETTPMGRGIMKIMKRLKLM